MIHFTLKRSSENNANEETKESSNPAIISSGFAHYRRAAVSAAHGTAASGGRNQRYDAG